MAERPITWIRYGTLLLLVAFGTLLSIRLGWWTPLDNQPGAADHPPQVLSGDGVPDGETWMSVNQYSRKIGYAHWTIRNTASGYETREVMKLSLNTMGMTQVLKLDILGHLKHDFSLADFSFSIASGLLNFSASGRVAGATLHLTTRTPASSQTTEIALQEKIYLTPGIKALFAARGLTPGTQHTFRIFDPTSLGSVDLTVRVEGREEIVIGQERHPAIKVAFLFKGATQHAWISEEGEILREKGLLGITLDKTTRAAALAAFPAEPAQDLTRLASIPVDQPLDEKRTIASLRLRLDLGGYPATNLQLDGDRQAFKGNELTITQEGLPEKPPPPGVDSPERDLTPYLAPSLLVEADHPKIVALAQGLTRKTNAPVDNARAILAWMEANIEKRPVLSIPDALATLENRIGDCNEHAVLLAALARAAGIPARIETGLVHLKGRFYYHAWNQLHLGRWVTADAALNQFPADATHIRLVRGDPTDQLDLLGLMGNLQLEVLNVDYQQ